MALKFVIIDDNAAATEATIALTAQFPHLTLVGTASTCDEAIDLILSERPDLIFLEIAPLDTSSKLSLGVIDTLHRYLKRLPKIITTANDTAAAFEAFQYEVLGFLSKPLRSVDVLKSVLRFERSIDDYLLSPKLNPSFSSETIVQKVIIENKSDQISPESTLVETEIAEESKDELEDVDPNSKALPSIKIENLITDEQPLIICVKSYGDYRFIEARDICYLQADNNSTDIHLKNGEMVTAYKTLKHFENILESPFVRIHNSYIVNMTYVSRIHTGNAVCYLKNSTTKLPFSKSYKDNVDAIISSITNGNYLEI